MPIFVGPAQVQKMYIGSAEVTSVVNSGTNVLGVPGSFPGVADSSLYIPLLNTLVPSRGTSAPTFTRATSAWVFDNEGKLRTVPSGCVRMQGARLVRNLTPKSSDFSSAEWAVYDLTKVSTSISDPLGGTTACELSAFGNSAGHYVTGGSVTAVSYTAGLTYCLSFYVKAGSITKAQLTHTWSVFGTSQYANFDLVSKTVITSVGCTPYIVDVGGGWLRLMIVVLATATTTGGGGAISALVTGSEGRIPTTTAGGNFYVACSQNEDVSGQANQTASEYVSVGVLSAPYHGAGVDGCKWFPTNKDGSAISSSTLGGYFAEPSRTNNCLWGRNFLALTWTESSVNESRHWIPSTVGSELVTNGTFDSDIAGWPTLGAGGTVTWSSGKIRVDSTSGNIGAYQDVSGLTIGKTYILTCNVTQIAGSDYKVVIYTNNTFTTTLKSQKSLTTGILFNATATTQRVYINISVTGSTIEVDNFSLKESAIQISKITGLDNVANSASRLTAAGNDATIMQLLTAATGTRTASAFIKRISGTGTVSITRNGGTDWTDVTSQLVSGTWIPVALTSDVGANPTVGIKMGTSGDVIEVDGFQDENGAWRTSPILTTTAAVTRNGDVLSYASAFDVTQGTALCSLRSVVPLNSGSEIYALSSESTARFVYWASTRERTSMAAYDSTTIISANTGSSINTGIRKRGVRWGADFLACSDGVIGTAGAFDGSMGSSAILRVGCDSSGGSQLSGPIREVHIWPTSLTDVQMQQVTS